MSLEGKLARHANSKIGLIGPRSGIVTDAKQGFILARAVVEPDHHQVVPLRVINMSDNSIELAASKGRFFKFSSVAYTILIFIRGIQVVNITSC